MRRLLPLLLAAPLGAAPLAAQTHLLVVSGLSGEPRFADEFHRQGAAVVDAARGRPGVERVVYLAEAPERDPSRIADRSTRDNVERALRRIAERAGPADRVLVVLLGHGSAEGGAARLNLPGPDLTAADLARMLEPLRRQPVVVVVAASASGDFQGPLVGGSRAVITATRSGLEANETVFGRFFAEGLTGTGADRDKDGRVSVLEAFEYATHEVERFYKGGNRLQTEHAVLGGSREVAAALHLGGGPAPTSAAADAPPELRALMQARERLEGEVAALRARKAEMEPARYEAELERLLLELARTSQRLRALGGTP